jgi:hypothetical protein
LKEQDERLNCFNRFVNAPSTKSTAATKQVSIQTLRTCLTIEDQVIAVWAAPAKALEDCCFVKEQDERLNCFNRFVNAPSKEYSPAKTQEATGIVVRVRQDSAIPAARQCLTNRLCSTRAINTIRKTKQTPNEMNNSPWKKRA